MKNNLTIFQILIIFITIGFYNSNQNLQNFKDKVNEALLSDGSSEAASDQTLEIYLDIFNKNQTNYKVLKKIKEILVEKKDYTLLIDCYNKYLDNSLNAKYKFEAEVGLIEIKIWKQDIHWLNDLYILEEKYTNDQNKKNKFEFILHQLFKNKKIEEGYDFVLFIRTKYNIPSFFSRKLISIFKENKEYKKSINESIIYLTETSKTNKKSSISQKILIEQIFDLTEKILLESILNKTYLPISDKQLSSNKFLNLKQDNEYESESIKYINNIYNTLIKYNLESEIAKIKLADIQYKIFSDLDSAYKILDKVQKKNI